jgi:hypothetical protein
LPLICTAEPNCPLIWKWGQSHWRISEKFSVY